VRIVKLIGHAKITPAGQACSTLLNGEEAAIGLTEAAIAGRLKQCRRQHERRHNLANKAHLETLLLLLE
jgi:hypothetical protein